jgi:hypothetical protein
MVVLDIGGDVGALVISAPAELAGAELEICPSGARETTPDEGAGWWQGEWRAHEHEHGHSHGQDAHSHARGPSWPHVAVLARPSPAGPRHAAVFPGLRAGRYDVWVRPDGASQLTVEVAGGEVTSADWSA